MTSKSALKNFNNAEYNSAAEKYNQILKEDDPKTNFLLAESYRKSNQIKKSADYYKKAIFQAMGYNLTESRITKIKISIGV